MINKNKIWNLVPANDTDEHEVKIEFASNGMPFSQCKCNPLYLQQYGDQLVIIHHSFDGREIVEEARVLANNVRNES